MFSFIYSTNIYKGLLKILDKCSEHNEEKHDIRTYSLEQVTKLKIQLTYKCDLK